MRLILRSHRQIRLEPSEIESIDNMLSNEWSLSYRRLRTLYSMNEEPVLKEHSLEPPLLRTHVLKVEGYERSSEHTHAHPGASLNN